MTTLYNLQRCEKQLEKQQIKNANLNYKLKKIEEAIKEEGGYQLGYIAYLQEANQRLEETHAQQQDTISKYQIMLNKGDHDTIEV